MHASTTSASPWAALLPAALAGTRRQPFAPLPGFTPALGGGSDAPEKQLLLTAASLCLVQRAGRRHLPEPADSLGRAGVEILPVLGPATVALLRQLEATQALAAAQGACVALTRGYRLAHRDLAGLFAGLPAGRHYRQLLRSRLGGQRGDWLLPWHPEGRVYERHYQHPPAADWWQTNKAFWPGTLLRLAEQRPPGGWQWLLAEWTAASLQQRQSLLTVLDGWAQAEFLPPVFYPLVEAQVAAMQEAARPTGRPLFELYQRPHSRVFWLGSQSPPEVLAQVPGGALLEPYWLRAQQLLSWEPGAPHLAVTLPSRADPTWAAYRQEYTFDQPDTWPQWVLHEELAWVTPSRWAAAWHLLLPETVTLAAASPHAHWLLNAWLLAATRHRDLPALRALLALPPWPDIWPAASCSYQLFSPALDQLPEAEQVAWRLSWLPALPHAPLPLNQYNSPITPNWLDWASDCSDGKPLPLTQQLGLVAFMRDYLALPAGTASPDPRCPVERRLADLLRHLAYAASLPLAAAIETQLLPLASRQPDRLLGAAVLESWPLLTFYRDFAATLAASPAP